jgi:hypothetical protein
VNIVTTPEKNFSKSRLRKAYPWAYALAGTQFVMAILAARSHVDPTVYLILCGLSATVGFINHRAHEHFAEQGKRV